MSYTPGPYQWEGDPRIYLVAADEQIVLWPGNAKADPATWAECLGACGERAEADADDNAALFAAAPDLLTACVDGLTLIGPGSYDAPAAVQMREAIRKAKGDA